MMASLHGFTSAEMFEARRALEMAIAGLAAERATGDQMVPMAEEITEMYTSLNQPEEFLIHDMRFHQFVAAASGNRILTALMNMVATILSDARKRTVNSAKDLKESAEMHRSIYRAIRDRTPDSARDAMRDHLMLASAQEAGVPTIVGDASLPDVLKAAGIDRARLIAVATPDSFQARRIVELARQLNSNLEIVARTHSATEVAALEALGAQRVVMGERELARSMTEHALRGLGVPPERARVAAGRDPQFDPEGT